MLEQIYKSSKPVGTRPNITCGLSKDCKKPRYGCQYFSPIDYTNTVR